MSRCRMTRRSSGGMGGFDPDPIREPGTRSENSIPAGPRSKNSVRMGLSGGTVTVLFLKRLLARRRDLSGRPADPLAAFLGPLEIRVLESLWRRGASSSVRDLEEDFPGSAYTTLMTTL